MRNAFGYTERKGMISSIIYSSGLISISFFTFMSEWIINPKKQKRPKDQEFFPMEIARNIHTYYYVMLICIISATTLCLLTLSILLLN